MAGVCILLDYILRTVAENGSFPQVMYNTKRMSRCNGNPNSSDVQGGPRSRSCWCSSETIRRTTLEKIVNKNDKEESMEITFFFELVSYKI